MVFGGAEELGAELKFADGGGGEVASSSSSITLAVTVAAEEENSNSSRDGTNPPFQFPIWQLTNKETKRQAITKDQKK